MELSTSMEMPEAIATVTIAESADYCVRPLLTMPINEYETRAAEFGHYPSGLPDPEHSSVLIVEEKATGKIVASWMILTAPFLEGLYVAPESRGTQSDIHRLLLGGMFSLLAAMNIPHPLTLADNPAILALARKAGFVPIAGTLLKLE